MKIFFVTILLATFLLGLILSLDLFLGTKLPQLYGKLKNPFEVPDPTEKLVVAFFFVFIIMKAALGFLKKKKGKKPASN